MIPKNLQNGGRGPAQIAHCQSFARVEKQTKRDVFDFLHAHKLRERVEMRVAGA